MEDIFFVFTVQIGRGVIGGTIGGTIGGSVGIVLIVIIITVIMTFVVSLLKVTAIMMVPTQLKTTASVM